MTAINSWPASFSQHPNPFSPPAPGYHKQYWRRYRTHCSFILQGTFSNIAYPWRKDRHPLTCSSCPAGANVLGQGSPDVADSNLIFPPASNQLQSLLRLWDYKWSREEPHLCSVSCSEGKFLRWLSSLEKSYLLIGVDGHFVLSHWLLRTQAVGLPDSLGLCLW